MSPDPMDDNSQDGNEVNLPTPFSSNEGLSLPAQQPGEEAKVEEEEEKVPEEPIEPLVYQQVGKYSLK